MKADKERLEALAREKAHSDKLRGRASDLQSDIAIKEQRHEDLRRECDELILANKRFYESSLKFREQYVRIDANQKDQNRLQSELNDVLQHVQELSGKIQTSYIDATFQLLFQRRMLNCKIA